MLKSNLVVWTFIIVTGFYMLVSIWNIAVFPDKTWTDYAVQMLIIVIGSMVNGLIAAFLMYAAAMLVKYINGGKS
ncbi:hypothetical protein ACTHOS_13180 [Bacillus safensis]|uniref:hypothetical protein n=1 Tax=Bacillus TaxID=1386 RepID=UPI00273B6A3F|nr:hypothetical protein [Bacillus safensis]MDP4564066.1 hypothetical protein [Bacillus safensis]MEC0921390.1 hypothetical protein [Bacillus safensis]MEC0993586.1 hypothetical protein [Bacillus safensis]MEC0997235.1 hypothetical protein [Bacillus safensis]